MYDEKLEKLTFMHRRADNNISAFDIDKKIAKLNIELISLVEKKYISVKKIYSENVEKLQKGDKAFLKQLRDRYSDRIDFTQPVKAIIADIKMEFINEMEKSIDKYKEMMKEELGVNKLKEEKDNLNMISSNYTGKILDIEKNREDSKKR